MESNRIEGIGHQVKGAVMGGGGSSNALPVGVTIW